MKEPELADETKRKRDRERRKPKSESQRRVEIARRLLSEFVGTFALTFVAAGGPVVAALTHGKLSVAAIVTAPGLMVMAMIYVVGPESGAHFNPEVTLAFALRHDFPWRWVPGYWLAQFLGGIVAALILRLLFGLTADVGATLPHYGSLVSTSMEALLTFLLITVILGTAAEGKLVGHNAALAVGGTIALDGLFAGPITGASMNTARSFGPALFGGQLSTMWIYVLGPLLGTLLAVGVAWLLRGPTNPDAVKSAGGE